MSTTQDSDVREELAELVGKALNRAWNLGQTYWQQADSDSYKQNKRADATKGMYEELRTETLAALSTPAPAAPAQAAKSDPVHERTMQAHAQIRAALVRGGAIRATEPDMRAVCEALGFDPTNHHNAAKCPYCRPTEQAASPVGVAERLEDFRKRHWMHWADSRDNELVCEAIAELGRFYGALAWALGTNGTFKPQGTMDGKYWWRSELAERAGLKWDGARYATEPTQAREARQLVKVSSIDVERLIAECVPGGDICDPQQVADSIRIYCNAWPDPFSSTSPKGST